MTKLRIGIIGLSSEGGWALRGHLPALQRLDQLFEIHGLVGSSGSAATRSAKALGIPLAFGSATELVDHPEIDVVVVSVKVPEHRHAVEAALAAGKPVYCEWPLGNGLAETEALAQRAHALGVPAFVGLQARSLPMVNALRTAIAEERIGEILSTSLIACAPDPWAGKITSRQKFLLDPASGGNMLTIPFGHAVDALRWTLGNFTNLVATSAIRRQSAIVEDTDKRHVIAVPDQIAVSGHLENGAVASIHLRGHVSPTRNFLWEINGTKGDILIEGGNAHLQFGQALMTTYRNGVAEQFDGAESSEAPEAPVFSGLLHAYRNLHSDLTTGSAFLPSFSDAVVTHRLIQCVERAAQSGTSQSYDHQQK